MTLELRVVSGSRAGVTERFEKSVVSIGRHPLSDLRFDPVQDLDVSTRHAELRGIDDVWTIHDQRSTNGTFVNGQRVEGERVLRDGDLITFGANGPRVQVVLAASHESAASHQSAAALAASHQSAAALAASDAYQPLGRGAPSMAKPPVTPVTTARAPRMDTTLRVAEAVKQQTQSMKRAFAAGAALLLVVVAGGVFVWQRQASARETELLALIARSDSNTATLERAVKEMAPRDSAFAALLQRQAEESRRSTQDLKRGGKASAGDIALYSSQVAAATRMQQAVGQMDLAGVHDRNDAAVAMVASDLDGTFIAGTAFGITTSGLMVTNKHVVRAESGNTARRVRVIFANTNEWLPAHVVRMDADNDLALLQLEVPDKFPVVAGVSRTGGKARVGAPVASIGYPHATDTPMEGSGLHITARSTIAAGTVSKRLDDVIQIDSYAGKGSSGSPLFDAQSNVVGVIYGGAPESGGRIVYAVPAERLAAFIARDAPSILRD